MNSIEAAVSNEDFQPREVATRLDRLFPTNSPSKIFPESTPVEIHAHKIGLGIEYSLLIGKPIRSGDLEQLLTSSSELPYSKDIARTHFLEGEDEFGGRIKADLDIFADLLDAPDDTSFLQNLAARLKTNDLAWQDLISQRGYAARLAEQISGSGRRNSDLYDVAKRIVGIMRTQPELWTDRTRSEGQSRDETLIERFGKLPGPVKGRILEVEMNGYEDEEEEKKRRIDLTYQIQFEFPKDGKEWFLIGREGNVVQLDDKKYGVFNGANKAVIEIVNNELVIHPTSAFLLPTLTWTNIGGLRRLVVPSRFDKKSMTFPAQNNRNVLFKYPLDPRQMENPVLALFAAHNILGFPASKEHPPEQMPEVAAMRNHEMLRSDLIINAEKTIGN